MRLHDENGKKNWKCPMKDNGPRRRGRRGGNNGGKSVNIYLNASLKFEE